MLRRTVERVRVALLDHFAGARRDWQWLTDAVFLARRDHMKTIEKQLGRSLDGTRRTGGSLDLDRGAADPELDPARLVIESRFIGQAEVIPLTE